MTKVGHESGLSQTVADVGALQLSHHAFVLLYSSRSLTSQLLFSVDTSSLCGRAVDTLQHLRRSQGAFACDVLSQVFHG